MIKSKSEPSWNGEPRLRRYRLTRGWGMHPSGRIECGRLIRTSDEKKLTASRTETRKEVKTKE